LSSDNIKTTLLGSLFLGGAFRLIALAHVSRPGPSIFAKFAHRRPKPHRASVKQQRFSKQKERLMSDNNSRHSHTKENKSEE